MIYTRRVLDARGVISSSMSWATTMLLMTVLFAPEVSTSWANATDETSHMEHCLTAEDIDFDGCKPEQLPITVLKTICTEVGLNVEDDVFPFLFAPLNGAKYNYMEAYTQEDYAAAAYECILVSEASDSQFDEGFINEVLAEGPEVLVNIVTDVMETNPGMMEELIMELKAHEPDVWNALESELTPEQSLLDVPGIISELVKALLHYHSDLFDIDDFEYEDDDEDEDDDDEDFYDDDEDLEEEL